MAKTEKQDIEFAIEIINDFRDNDEIMEVEYAMTLLDNVDRTAHPAEMKKVREALRENKALHAPYVTRQLAIPSLARQGYWWYDPSKW